MKIGKESIKLFWDTTLKKGGKAEEEIIINIEDRIDLDKKEDI